MRVFNAAFPILPGQLETALAFGPEVLGARRAEFEEFQRRRGVTKETWSIQQTPDGQAFSVVWFESPDPELALTEGAKDPSAFAAWFREKVLQINGVDLDPEQPLPRLPHVTLDWES